MLGSLLIVGFALSLDNFRTAVVLGVGRFSWKRTAQISLTFGFWDGLAPLVGILVGDYVGEKIGSTADYIGAATLAAYGLYLIVEALRTPAPEEGLDFRFALFGLPLPLSVDNVVAGTSLGLLGYSPWLAPPLFGFTTAVVSVAGLQLGRVIGHLIHIRPDLLTGVALLLMGAMLGLGILG
ncbi:MAG TPA: manganese efflux pump [Solirubrobacteraceae bacterium]|jgi:putative Mn2+ efflux pump MntP